MTRLSIVIARLLLGAALAAVAVSGASIAQPAAGANETAPQIRETDEEKLERLFGELAAMEDPEASHAIADQIQALWAKSGSDSMDLLLTRARGAMQREDFARARAHVAALNRLAPDFAEGWNASATLNYLQENLAASVADIERVLHLNPRQFSAMTGLALILERVDRQAEALKVWREVNALYPGFDTANEAIERLTPEVDGRAL